MSKIERKAYDPEMIALRARTIIYVERPELRGKEITKAQNSPEYKERAYRWCLAFDLAKKIQQECLSYDWEQCEMHATRIIENIHPELFLNINEWIDGEPISAIPIHGVTIKEILDKHKEKNVHFLQVLDYMIAWKRINHIDRDFHEMYFARYEWPH